LCCVAICAAVLSCRWSNIGTETGRTGAAGAAGATTGDGSAGSTSSDAGAAGALGGAAGAAGRADDGGAAGGAGAPATTGQGGVTGAQVKYAGTIVNPASAGNEVIFRRIDPPSGLCVLVDVVIAADGEIPGPRTVYALPTDTAGCLTATTANRVAATGSTGAITSPDRGAHFNIDLSLFFPAGMDWLGPSVTFKVMSLPLDGAWYPGP
jgi:hypothetical protein